MNYTIKVFSRKFISVISLFFLVLSNNFLIAQTDNLIYNELTSPRSGEYYHMPVGLCEDYPEETTTMETIRNDFEFLKKYGVKHLRISFGWDAIEVEQGKYDWLFWDDFVKMAVDEYDITLVPYICYTPRWISKGAHDTLYFWNYPPKDNKPYGDFVRTLVNRYKDRIKTWELWNEPDIWIYWQGTRQEFVDFLKAGAEAVRVADPDAKIVFPGIAYDPDFVKSLFKDYNMSKYFDIVNMHNYYETWHRHPIEEITTYINEVQDVVWRYGDNQPLWMAEVGYSTFRKGARVSDAYSAYFDYEHSPEYQAVHLFKTLVLTASTENIESVAWYEIKDLPPHELVIGDNDNNRYLGVAYPDHKPKPAARALQFFNELFSQKYKSIDNMIWTDKTVGSDVQVHGFENEDGSLIISAWIQTIIPGKQMEDKSGDVKDTRQETVSVKIPLKAGNKATLYNELGEGKEFTSVRETEDGIELKDISLQGGGLIVIEVKK
ncbi:MAG: beta-galactosidase [Ignavibacteriaceae bacterium]